MQNALSAAWWPRPSQMQPLEAIKITAECLEQGAAVPTQAAVIVARALRQYFEGKTDITRNLGMRPRRGGTYETPLKIEQYRHRNQAIQALYTKMPARSKTGRAEQVVELLHKPPDPRVTEAEVLVCVKLLQEKFGGTLPNTSRQILNIISATND